MTRVATTLTAAFSGILFLAPTAEARADQKQECSAAYDATQSLRDEGKLLDARTQALVCSGAPCPAFVREDCAQWLSEIDAVVPTVVFTAKDAAGSSILAVRVILDGRVLLDRLDGSAVAMDPGAHHVRFEIAATGVLEKEIVVRRGEKNRTIDASFESRVAQPTLPSVKPESETKPKPVPSPVQAVVPIVAVPVAAPVPKSIEPFKPSKTTVPTWGWISGGTGVGLGLIGAVFANSSWNANEAAAKQCGGNVKICSGINVIKAAPFLRTRDDHRTVFIALTTVGSMALLGGILGSINAGLSTSKAPNAVSFAPIVSPAGGGFLARGVF